MYYKNGTEQSQMRITTSYGLCPYNSYLRFSVIFFGRVPLLRGWEGSPCGAAGTGVGTWHSSWCLRRNDDLGVLFRVAYGGPITPMQLPLASELSETNWSTHRVYWCHLWSLTEKVKHPKLLVEQRRVLVLRALHDVGEGRLPSDCCSVYLVMALLHPLK